MVNKGMPLAEFVELLQEASAAAEKGDALSLLSINEKIKSIGYSLVSRNGEVHIKNENIAPDGETYQFDVSVESVVESEGNAAITLGMGATEQVGSDRYPYTVVEIISPKHIVVQRDDFKRIDNNGLSEMQTYEYTRNTHPLNVPIHLRLSKNGWGRGSGSYRRRFGIGHRNAYQDPHR